MCKCAIPVVVDIPVYVITSFVVREKKESSVLTNAVTTEYSECSDNRIQCQYSAPAGFLRGHQVANFV